MKKKGVSIFALWEKVAKEKKNLHFGYYCGFI